MPCCDVKRLAPATRDQHQIAMALLSHGFTSLVFFLNYCFTSCACVHVWALYACSSLRGQKRESYLLGLKLQTVVSAHVYAGDGT